MDSTYPEDEVGVVGVRARGVKSINLREGDFVVSGQIFSSESKPDLLIATQRGAVKKMRVTEIETGSRANRGTLMLRELKQNPHRIVGMKLLETKATLTLVTEKGEEVQISNANYNFNDRYSNGSFVIDEATNGQVVELYEELKLEEDSNK